MKEIKKAYNSKEIESYWFNHWVEAGAFDASISKEKEPFSIMIPPPNVTGMLHMGHVLDNTLQDILVRRARLEGKSVLWQPGTDHAGIATQTKVEKQLKDSLGITKYDLGREKFIKKVWDFREESGGVILNQLKRLGASCDWRRTSFTLDKGYSDAVVEAFVRLYKRGFIYRGKRMVNWCPKTQTAISDEEVIMKPQRSYMYKMRYELVEKDEFQNLTHLEISTTRPETLMGDSAVAVHPKDERYRHLIGKYVWRPFPKEKIPIIGDDYVDREFGTGCLKVTPAHDKNDFEIGQRHNLKTIEVINAEGNLNELAGKDLCGVERFVARKLVSEKLEKLGLLVSKDDYENTIGFSERGDAIIEPRLSEQWFLKYPKVKEAKRAVEKGIIRFYPDRWKKTYLHWLNGIQDWCISRQLWWGHRIPVWYNKKVDKEKLDYTNKAHVYVGSTPPDNIDQWEQDNDVLDTWASSFLWPMANLGWPNPDNSQKQEMKYWYPTTTLVTGFDIIFFWVARMIMAGLELFDENKDSLSDEEIEKRIPFRNIYIHGLIRDSKGRKMSKSLGNSPDPLALIEKFGADGLRFGICDIAPSGSDILFSEDRVQIGRNFCNKLWNASRFRQLSGEQFESQKFEDIVKRFHVNIWDDYDHWILARLIELTAKIDAAFETFDLAALTHLLYKFFWNDFCDWYVEASKSKINSKGELAENCLAIQDFIFRHFLQLSHPIIPHITEELWKEMGFNANDNILIEQSQILKLESLKSLIKYSISSVERVENLQVLIQEARSLKAQFKLASNKNLTLYYDKDSKFKNIINSNIENIKFLGGFLDVNPVSKLETEGMAGATTMLATIYIDIRKGLNVEAERERLKDELKKINKLVEIGEKKLANTKFISAAPKSIVEGARKQYENTLRQRNQLTEMLEKLN